MRAEKPITDSTAQPIDTLVDQFFAQLRDVEAPRIERYPITRFQHDSEWPKWAASHGVYFFEQGGAVLFVGRALREFLKDRVRTQCNSFGDPKWDPIIRELDGPTTVGVVPLPREAWYLAASLEAMLIDTIPTVRWRRI